MKSFFVITSILLFSVAAYAGHDCHDEAKSEKPGLIELQPLFPEAASINEKMEADEYMEYDRGSLFDYINGGAEVYLDLGFIRVGARDYMLEIDNEEVYFTLDVYDMGKPLQAFGIFSQERYGDIPPVEIGVDGYIGGGSLTYWTNRYYVKVRADSEGEVVNKILMTMANAINAKLGDPGKAPCELCLFPAPFKLPNRDKYSSSNILGFGYLKGFTCLYENEGQEMKLYLCPYDDAKAALEVEKKLVEKMKPVPSKDGQGFCFDARYQGKGRIVRVDRFVIIAQGFAGDDAQDAWKQLNVITLIDNVSNHILEAKAMMEKNKAEAAEAK